MPTLVLEWDRRLLKPLKERGLEKALVRALSKAGGDAIRAVRIASSRGVRFRKRMKLGKVNKALVLRFPQRGAKLAGLVWREDVNGASSKVSDYPGARQVGRKVFGRKGRQSFTDGGVSVGINKGKRSFIPGAFIVTLRSGHQGIFKRVGDKRLPIEELYSTRVVDVFHDNGASPAFLEQGRKTFASSFARLLPLEIEKMRAAAQGKLGRVA